MLKQQPGYASTIRPGKPMYQYVFKRLVEGKSFAFPDKVNCMQFALSRPCLPGNTRYPVQREGHFELREHRTCERRGVGETEGTRSRATALVVSAVWAKERCTCQSQIFI